MKTTKRALTAAVLLSCACLMAPYYAHAEEVENYPNENPVYDFDITTEQCESQHTHNYQNITYNGSVIYNLDIYTNLNHPGKHWFGDYEDNNGNPVESPGSFDGNFHKVIVEYRDFGTNEVNGLNKAFGYLESMVKRADNAAVPLISLKLFPDQDANASASSDTLIVEGNDGKPIQISDSKLAAVLQGKYTTEPKEIVAETTVDLAPPGTSWYIDKFPVLPSNGKNSDYYGTITHEMFHALGLGTYISENTKTFGTSGNYYDNGVHRSMSVFNKYEMGIRDVFNRVVYYSVDAENRYVTYDNKPIDPNNTNDWNRIQGELISRVITPITVAEYNEIIGGGRELDDTRFYVLRDTPTEEGRPSDSGAQLKLNNTNQLNPDLKIGTNGGAYFTGKNVEEVLTTNGQLAQIAWPDGSEVPAVPGLPLNGYESATDAEPELSHIELQNSLMSHQSYRNWCTFMEAEIALLQDLGYTIDRSKYFGKSIYNSGTAAQYFTYDNGQAFDSTTMHGIGLHVYGSYVDVTQNADINANGDYGIGIRVDGVGNKVTINSNVSANGEGGNGLLVAYGKKHNITLNAGKTIEATGTDGVAARFDFGSNELGDLFEYRGSYILTRYTSKEDIDEMIEADPDNSDTIIENHKIGWSPITEGNLLSDINGELVTNFNVAGTLKGEKAAIYISENALVQKINIMNGADIQGDIISKWNPDGLIYDNPSAPTETENQLASQNDNCAFNSDYQIRNDHIEPFTDQETDLNFGVKVVDNALSPDSDFNMSYGGSIQGETGIRMLVQGGTLEYNGTAKVLSIDIYDKAKLSGKGTYILSKVNSTRGTLINNGTFNLGDGIATISITGNYSQPNGNLLVDFNTNSESDNLIVHEGTATLYGYIKLTPQVDYYYNGQTIKLDPIVSVDENYALNASPATPEINNISPVLKFTVVDNDKKVTDNGEIVAVPDGETPDCDYGSTKYVIKVERIEQGYQSVATDDISSSIGSAIVIGSQKTKDEPQYIRLDKEALLSAIDFPLTITDSDAERKKVASNNLKKLNPNVVGSQAQAVIETHTTLNNLVSTVSSLNVGSMSMNTPVSRRVGGLGPNRVEPPKYNSWRNIVIPFSSYTDQHNGSNGYTNHNSGVIGAMERTFANGLTHGYHAALNHQSTEDSGSTIKGEGIYLGTHASYAPVEWNGWSVFGSARLGVEQMRSHRTVYIADSLRPYFGTADGDWTGYSGSFNIGAALTKEHGVVKSGPFAALDYSFAHRPSVHEDGGAVRTNLESATYDSLRTQLGYRIVTNPKPLYSYDSTQWQAHASVAWNHELLNNNGRTSYELAEFPGTPIEDTIETYGRDSMSIAAGVIFKTPNRLDVGLTLGSDIYRKGGSSVYGKVNLEWKF